MKKLKKIAVVFMAIILCMPFVNITTAKAAGTARVSIGSASGEIGHTVSVTVSIDASFDIGGATIYISYDTSMLEPASGSNTGTVTCNFLDSSASSSQSASISFRIKAAGTSSLNVIGDSKVISMDYDNASISKSSGSVTGKAPASYSSDNTLSSLQISPGVLSPAFSPNVTAYTTSVGSDCERLTVSAVANDSNATVNISGTRMDPGLNTTTITVTAENGSKRTYTIKTTKADDIKSPEEASKAADAQENNNHGTDNNGAAPVQEPSVGIDGSEYRIVSSYEEHPLPAGYVQSETDYNGIKISVGMGMNTRVMLAYLENTDGTGESGFYVYDSVNKTFSKYIEVYQPELSYCILPIDSASMELPDGYETGRIDINGQEVDALLDKTGNYALFYGVSSTGEAGWFRFNTNDGTIQGYAGYNTSDEPVLINSRDKAAANQNGKGIFKTGIFSGVSNVVLIILALLVIIVIILVIAVVTLSRKLSVSKKAFVKAIDTDIDEYDETDEDEELTDESDDGNSGDMEADVDGGINDDVSDESDDDILTDEPEELALEEIELEETNSKDIS